MVNNANKTIIITGAQGFLGHHLIASCRIAFPDYQIIGIVRQKSEALNIECREIDLLVAEKMKLLLQEYRPEYLFHLAGSIAASDWTDLYSSNVLTTANICASLDELGLNTRVIIPGSAAEYGNVDAQELPIKEGIIMNPVSPYGVSKVGQSNLVQYYMSKGMDIVLARVFNVIGRGMATSLSIGSFAKQIKEIQKGERPPQIKVGNLSSKRDFLDVKDVSAAFIHLARKGRGGEIYNVCSGKSISMDAILEMMIKSSGVSVEILVDKDRFRLVDCKDIYGSNKKISIETGWTHSVPLTESIDKLFSDKV